MKLVKKIRTILEPEVVHAHCDIPCGIYDPHHAQMAAHTIIRMLQLMEEAKAKFEQIKGPSAEERRRFIHTIARYTATKEQHAEILKNEVRILWGDYFKPEHVQQFPELHELVWKIMKHASKARQEINMQESEELLAYMNKLAEIFWKTKGVETVRVKAFYPTGKEIVVPRP